MGERGRHDQHSHDSTIPWQTYAHAPMIKSGTTVDGISANFGMKSMKMEYLHTRKQTQTHSLTKNLALEKEKLVWGGVRTVPLVAVHS